MQPLTIPSPAFTSRGRLSPVSALVFKLASPSTITPSIGTFSPGCTTITLPTATSPGSTCSSLPSVSMFAQSGRMSMSAEMFRRLLPTAQLWNSSPIW